VLGGIDEQRREQKALVQAPADTDIGRAEMDLGPDRKRCQGEQ
jgi:hypothetical protein